MQKLTVFSILLKKSLLVMMCLGAFALHADQSYNDFSIAELTLSSQGNQVLLDDSDSLDELVSKGRSVITNVFAFQYTTDGWLQHVGIYSDSVICTNIEGPREGVQFIIANNGALMDMCHTYKEHKDHVTHKYSWGEVNTYSNYQQVKFK